MARGRLIALTAAVLFAGVACGGAEPRAAPTLCPRAAALEPPSTLPRVLDQTSHGDVVEVGRRRGFTAVKLISDETVVELYPQLARGLVEGGHEIVSGDNEGFEAEIFFALRDGRAGRYLLREGPCRGEVTLHILYEDRK